LCVICVSSKCVEECERLFGLDEDECEDFCLVIALFEDEDDEDENLL